MNKYIIFGFEYYYPDGGVDDIEGYLNNVEELNDFEFTWKLDGEDHIFYDKIHILNVETKAMYKFESRGDSDNIDSLNLFIENVIKAEL